MAKKFYEGEDEEKKVTAVFSPEQIKKLRFLQLQHEMPEKEVIVTAIEEMYVRSIEMNAVETGVIKNPSLTLSRSDFSDEALFNSICLQANVFGPDGKVQTVRQISLEVGKVFVSDTSEDNSDSNDQIK